MTDRIDILIQQMTLDEKILLLAGADLWHTHPIPRLGIPSLKVTDGPNGARGALDSMGPTSVATPVGTALSATWNTALVEQVGEVLGDETRAKGAQVLLAPTINIHRTPNAGRNFECYSEDPYLSGKMASAYIRGLQSRGVGACIKHFVCNDQDHERFSISAEVQERPLHEIYLEPFRRAMREAKPWSLMSAYNRINGRYASENDYTLKTILKRRWGFDGLVMSDWFGTYSADVPAGGLDLEMPGPARWMGVEHVHAALESGALTEADLDDKVRRLLRLMERTGLLEHPERQPEQAIDKPEHRQVVRQAAREAIVLLKNQAVLPLNAGQIKSIAVIGENARWAQVIGGGSSTVSPHYAVSPLEGIRQRAGDQIRVAYALGCPIHRTLPAPDPKVLSTPDGQRGLRFELFDNPDFSGAPAFSIVNQRVQFNWFDNTVPNVDQHCFSLRLSGYITPQDSGRHLFGLTCVGRAWLTIAGSQLEHGRTENEPGGQKTLQVELQAGERYPIQVEYVWEGMATSRSLSLGYLPPEPADLTAEAVRVAGESDVVIVVAGLTREWESEGFDRPDIELPGAQNELIAKVAAVNPNTVVVLNCGSPVSMPWLDQVAGVVQLWYDGQEQGHALAEVLFGDICPSGKLPLTFPKRLQDNPAFINYPGENGKVLYGEGIYVGYRYYDHKDVEPLFPFGYGLSYTTFDYQNLRVTPTQARVGQPVKVSVDVKNTGPRSGQEIVQLYVHDAEARLPRPEKELKAFVKVMLEPGATQTIHFELEDDAFWYYDPHYGGWQVEPGAFEIWVGASSRDIRLKGAVVLTPEDSREAGRLHTGLSLRTLMNDEDGVVVLTRHFPNLINLPEAQTVMDLSLNEIAQLLPQEITPRKINEVNIDLSRLPGANGSSEKI